MAIVNPPPIRPPNKWMNDQELSKDVQELYFYMFQLWQRTGAGTDLIEQNEINIVLLDEFKANLSHNLMILGRK